MGGRTSVWRNSDSFEKQRASKRTSEGKSESSIAPRSLLDRRRDSTSHLGLSSTLEIDKPRFSHVARILPRENRVQSSREDYDVLSRDSLDRSPRSSPYGAHGGSRQRAVPTGPSLGPIDSRRGNGFATDRAAASCRVTEKSSSSAAAGPLSTLPGREDTADKR